MEETSIGILHFYWSDCIEAGVASTWDVPVLRGKYINSLKTGHATRFFLVFARKKINSKNSVMKNLLTVFT